LGGWKRERGKEWATEWSNCYVNCMHHDYGTLIPSLEGAKLKEKNFHSKKEDIRTICQIEMKDDDQTSVKKRRN